jgi:DNA gyrase subunit A
MDQYPRQGRGGKGVTAMRLTPRTGDIVGAGMARPDQTVIMISSSGQVIRIPVAQISRIGRATQGVTLMRLEPGETVASLTVVDPKADRDDGALGDLNGLELAVADAAR